MSPLNIYLKFSPLFILFEYCFNPPRGRRSTFLHDLYVYLPSLCGWSRFKFLNFGYYRNFLVCLMPQYKKKKEYTLQVAGWGVSKSSRWVLGSGGLVLFVIDPFKGIGGLLI